MIELRVSEPDPIILEAEEQDQASLAVLEAFVSGGDIPAYTGSYNVTPTQSQQTLETNGKKMVRDVKVAPIPSQYIIPEGTLEVTQNGQQSVREYENVNVAVPTVTPTGEKTINVTQNGTTTEDVTNYATAKVVTNVPASAVDSGTKAITANGNGQDVVGYATVNVNVPNSYAAADEGKVVQSGALVSQSSQTIDTNGTYDTTLKNEVVVDVQGGGGLTLESALDGVIAGTITTYENPTITTIPDSMFRAAMWNKITSFKAHNVTSIQNYGVGGIGTKNMAFPNITGINVGFIGNSKVEKIDLGSGLSNLSANAFNNANALDTLILRRSSSLVTLSNANAFNNNHFKSGGTGGTIYIPKVLYDHLGDNSSLDYKKATNWTTVNGYGTITWAKIEGSIYENAYADGTPIT